MDIYWRGFLFTRFTPLNPTIDQVPASEEAGYKMLWLCGAGETPAPPPLGVSFKNIAEIFGSCRADELKQTQRIHIHEDGSLRNFFFFGERKQFRQRASELRALGSLQ